MTAKVMQKRNWKKPSDATNEDKYKNNYRREEGTNETSAVTGKES